MGRESLKKPRNEKSHSRNEYDGTKIQRIRRKIRKREFEEEEREEEKEGIEIFLYLTISSP